MGVCRSFGLRQLRCSIWRKDRSGSEGPGRRSLKEASMSADSIAACRGRSSIFRKAMRPRALGLQAQRRPPTGRLICAFCSRLRWRRPTPIEGRGAAASPRWSPSRSGGNRPDRPKGRCWPQQRTLGPETNVWIDGANSTAPYSPRAKSFRRARKFGRAGPILLPGSMARDSLADLRAGPTGPVRR